MYTHTHTRLTDKEIDLYEVLGVPRPHGDELLKDDKVETHSSTVSRLRAAYHRRATKWHPSNFKSRYQLVTTLYAKLCACCMPECLHAFCAGLLVCLCFCQSVSVSVSKSCPRLRLRLRLRLRRFMPSK